MEARTTKRTGKPSGDYDDDDVVVIVVVDDDDGNFDDEKDDDQKSLFGIIRERSNF